MSLEGQGQSFIDKKDKYQQGFKFLSFCFQNNYFWLGWGFLSFLSFSMEGGMVSSKHRWILSLGNFCL